MAKLSAVLERAICMRRAGERSSEPTGPASQRLLFTDATRAFYPLSPALTAIAPSLRRITSHVQHRPGPREGRLLAYPESGLLSVEQACDTPQLAAAPAGS